VEEADLCDLDDATGLARLASAIDFITPGRFRIVRGLARPDFLVEIVSIDHIGER
jgi:hypothetical protein